MKPDISIRLLLLDLSREDVVSAAPPLHQLSEFVEIRPDFRQKKDEETWVATTILVSLREGVALRNSIATPSYNSTCLQSKQAQRKKSSFTSITLPTGPSSPHAISSPASSPKLFPLPRSNLRIRPFCYPTFSAAIANSDNSNMDECHCEVILCYALHSRGS